jgi:hypothetical protein
LEKTEPEKGEKEKKYVMKIWLVRVRERGTYQAHPKRREAAVDGKPMERVRQPV